MSATDTSWFSPNYAVARDRFRALVSEKGGRCESLLLEAKGPNDEPLNIDIGWFGAERPRNVLLHSSGLHGIEGFAGSAIQLAAIASDQFSPPDGDAVIWVHALNPFGMSWHRRVNESNVDLNRNFLEPGVPYEGVSDGYKTMHTILNPASPPRFDLFLLRSVVKIIRYGFNTLKQAVTEGQYAYPKGLFFGGEKLEDGPRLYSEWIANNLAGAERVLAIDIHTGLGKSGEDTLLVEAGLKDPLYLALAEAFGDRVTPWDAGNSVAYQIKGGYPDALPRILRDTKVEFITQEFGTIPALKVLFALREENRCHHYGGGALTHPAKQLIMDAFCPGNDEWRRAILKRGRELLIGARDRLKS